MTTTPGRTPSDERLKRACLHLVGQVGFDAATTRAIAAEAGVNEVTLFRRFSSKAELVAQSMAWATEPFRDSALEPTDDLAHDLVMVAERYHQFVSRWPKLIGRLLGEASGDGEIGPIARHTMGQNAAAIRRLFTHHLLAGRLRADTADEAMIAFLGPILTGVTIGTALSSDGGQIPFDPERHVGRFLHGAASTT